jgi:hypothetical protein
MSGNDNKFSQKRAELEAIVEEFLVKCEMMTRPDGIRVQSSELTKQAIINDCNKLLDQIEEGYLSTGAVIHTPSYVRDM